MRAAVNPLKSMFCLDVYGFFESGFLRWTCFQTESGSCSLRWTSFLIETGFCSLGLNLALGEILLFLILGKGYPSTLRAHGPRPSPSTPQPPARPGRGSRARRVGRNFHLTASCRELLERSFGNASQVGCGPAQGGVQSSLGRRSLWLRLQHWLDFCRTSGVAYV